jgi:hypothetical protein
MRIDNPEERHFYEIESKRQNWSYKWLQRQQASSLYERLAISEDIAQGCQYLCIGLPTIFAGQNASPSKNEGMDC